MSRTVHPHHVKPTPHPWRRRHLLWLIGLLVLATDLSCTEAKLEPIPPPPVFRDDKIEIQGNLCTQPPETLVFPLRVLFVIDSSISMDVSDPPDPVSGTTGRERAVRETWTGLLDQGAEGVRVGILRFSAQARSRTTEDFDGDNVVDSYYTADTAKLDIATQSLAVTDRTTNYINALGEAYFEMRTELLAAEKESLPLSKYVVIFLSDGTPDVDTGGGRDNSFDQIADSVEAMRKLAEDFRVGDFAFHTAFIASGRESLDKNAQELLSRMAEIGRGNFRSFPNGEELNFLFVDFTVLRRIFALKTLSAININTIVDPRQMPPKPLPVVAPEMGMMMTPDMSSMDMSMAPTDMSLDMSVAPDPRPNPLAFVDLDRSEYVDCGEPMVDTDGDGLADLLEIRIGTNPWLQDTDDDGLKDYIEWELSDDGLNPLDPADSQCYIPSPCVDEDNDGFCDCVLDDDADGICNCAEAPDPNRPTVNLGIDNPVCADAQGHDCVDVDEDGQCDCPDVDKDGRCDYVDRDGDGLHDCEEVFFGSAKNGVDSDADGLPDNVEVRAQTNPAKRDLQDDLDADQTLNVAEVLANTSPICDDSALRSRVAYRYELTQRETVGTSTCYDFRISNVTIVPTATSPYDTTTYPGNGLNRILVYAGEVAFDDPRAFARYRVACIVASYNPDGNYKNPPSGKIKLTQEDFVEVSEFDPDIHCKLP